jgi:hypothetical protein
MVRSSLVSISFLIDVIERMGGRAMVVRQFVLSRIPAPRDLPHFLPTFFYSRLGTSRK